MASDTEDTAATPPALLGTLRTALVFGGAAVVFALVAAPIAARYVEPSMIASTGQLDHMSTGSIPRTTGTSYVLRRSVLQDSPSAVCVIRSNGARSGSC